MKYFLALSHSLFCVITWLSLGFADVAAQEKQTTTLRVATYNIAMNREKSGGMINELKSGKSEQAQKIAEIIQLVRPDVILLCELDQAQKSLPIFQEKYLNVAQGQQKSIDYKYSYTANVNTGQPSGLDLNNDGKTGGPNDAFGYGKFPGQYSMAVLSRFPIDKENVRTFQKFLWRDMPGMKWPIDPATNKSFYSDDAKKVFRLSSKNHWDVPILVDGIPFHFLTSHPTPPVFDGPENRNGLRNADEIRFWGDYINGKNYFVDDQGRKGGLQLDDSFVIAGDLNADPHDGDSANNCIASLLANPKINSSFVPQSDGARQAASISKGANIKHQGDPSHDTGDFNDATVGNLRIDYVLPSRKLNVKASGVFWPATGKPGHDLVGASDHRLVWVDFAIKPNPKRPAKK
jgi:3-phytase/alkaline phosphatase D